MPWGLVLAACIGMFAATATGSTRAPFLPDMAADLGVGLPAIANLFGLTAATWGVSAYIAGYVSDRIGRVVFLVVSPALLAAAMVAASLVPSYAALVLVVIFASTCCGAFTTSALAEVSLRSADSHQGRALGYVMSGQSLTLLFGIPVAAWLGASVGWRGIHLALAALAIVATLCMVVALRLQPKVVVEPGEPKSQRTSLRQALSGPVVRLFMALVMERIVFGLSTFYYASYLRVTYDLAINAVAIPLALFAAGNIAGTVVGGQVADRFPYRRLSFAVALICAGCIAVPWFLWRPAVGVTVTLGVLFAFFDALSRPSLLAALAEVPTDVRGVVMGLNSSVASAGWLTAALVGGWLYAGIGFSSFSVLMALTCLAGALIVLPDSRVRLPR